MSCITVTKNEKTTYNILFNLFSPFSQNYNKKIALSYGLNCLDKCKYFKHIKFFSFYEKESYNVTIIPSWDSADDVQYINVDVILNTVHWLADNIYVHCEQFLENLFLGMFRTQSFCMNQVRNITFFSTALPRGSCVNRKMGPPTSYFLVFFYFQGWKERERKRED
jgi:hypothetical protein